MIGGFALDFPIKNRTSIDLKSGQKKEVVCGVIASKTPRCDDTEPKSLCVTSILSGIASAIKDSHGLASTYNAARYLNIKNEKMILVEG